MNKIIVFIKGLLQLSTILVGIFGLFLFIGGGWLYHDLQDIINDKIYAMNDDVYVIINQESNTIIVYYLNPEDVEIINNFTRLQQWYYGDNMILQPIESLGPSETFDIYKKLSEAPGRFQSQGSRISF